MSLRIYTDVHVRRAIVEGLRLRGVEVITAQEDGTAELTDPALMDRATELGYLLLTHDDDLLSEAVRRQEVGIPFSGVVYIHQLRVVVRKCIEDLELIAKLGEPEEFRDRIEYLPL